MVAPESMYELTDEVPMSRWPSRLFFQNQAAGPESSEAGESTSSSPRSLVKPGGIRPPTFQRFSVFMTTF